jgi:regulator of replication initiation timing
MEGSPLLIESVEYSRFGEARLVVEVMGRWLEDPPLQTGDSALVIVDGNGLVHRFAEIASAGGEVHAGDEYLGSFVIPAQFSRWLAGDSKVRAGGVTVAMPSATLVGEASPEEADAIPDATLDPTVGALREELSRRVADDTHLRGEVSRLRSQLEARAHNFDRLEEVQSELRSAIAELRERVEATVAHNVALESSNAALEAANASLSAELAATRVSYETALEEVDQLRSELDRGGAELAEVLERSGADEVEEAENLLAEARALTARLMAGE